MVDVFGSAGTFKGQKGPPGPMGPRGFPGSIKDLCEWLPQSVLESLRKNDEIGSFFITDPSKDLEQSGKVVKQWVSRSNKGLNLVADIPSSDLVKLPDRYVLGFKKNRYASKDIFWLENEPGTNAFICITFKVFGDEEKVLISNFHKGEDNYCEVRVSATEIRLHLHNVDEIIQHSCKEWTTLYLECNSDDTTTYYKYDVNGKTGSFTGTPDELFFTGSLAMGSRPDDTFFLNGQVSALEIYEGTQPSEVPKPLKDIIIKHQRIVL